VVLAVVVARILLAPCPAVAAPSDAAAPRPGCGSLYVLLDSPVKNVAHVMGDGLEASGPGDRPGVPGAAAGPIELQRGTRSLVWMHRKSSFATAGV